MPEYAARAAAQRYCGWHVTPVETTQVVVNGPGGPLLTVPTLKLVQLLSITEDGVSVNLSTVEWSPAGLIRKKSGANWTSALGGVVVSMTHGYDLAEDFEQAVELIDSTIVLSGRDDAAMTGKRVGDVEYQWSVTLSGVGSAATLLDKFRLPGAP